MRRRAGKPLVWLHGEVRTPPLTAAARVEAGELLRRLQRGEALSLPHSRPMPALGRRSVLDVCRRRLRTYDAISAEKE